MSRVYIAGLGAVSAAGWGVSSLRTALQRNTPLPAAPVPRPGCDQPMWVCEVPPPAVALPFALHPRLRRASAITHYAAAAAFEALEAAGLTNTPPRRLGLIICLLSGCVRYTERFYSEVRRDPSTASPVLFPETVFDAPGSHLATLLGTPPLHYTLLGDPASYLQGLALGADWLLEGRVEACLVIGAEETNWLLADALRRLEPSVRLAGGAGAVLLSPQPGFETKVELAQITEPYLHTARRSLGQAAKRMRADLPPGKTDELLCDSLQGCPRLDEPEAAAWHDWPGARVTPKRVLGEGLMAAGAWQCVAAADAVQLGRFAAVNVSTVGASQQAIGARFCRIET
jgi:3-oxoacyl-[acyl-carrier-protein] synthase II